MKDLKSLDIGVLYGGWSAEREISIKSGDTVLNCLLENGYKAKPIDLVSEEIATKEKTYEGIDLAFILVHGRGGEDGAGRTRKAKEEGTKQKNKKHT